ncbi:phage/plasmid primase, P4 family [Parasutterella excrementihominis]|uniref:phage/plasmid primase, P4 family n=1 Tax=Parasutterella excrementihominis TaxID=487175 RepID=UPI00242ED23D|nr:phage/plasmid primase, P4 family [Parasutterella excrementihominis]
MTGFIRDIGPKLIDQGYQVCAVKPGEKAPRYDDWTREGGLTKKQCEAWNPTWGVGVLCGVGENPICCIDVDALDPVVSAEMRKWMEKTFDFEYMLYERVGQAPKFALICRADVAGISKEATAEYVRDPDDEDEIGQRLEFLGKGQQFCAYHVHPDTNKPYVWPEVPLVEVPAADLPVITKEHMLKIKAAFVEICTRLGYVPRRGNDRGLSSDSGELDEVDWGDTSALSKLTIDQAKEYLFGSEFDVSSYEDWLRAGMALHNHFDGDYEALKLWDEWSSKASNYVGFEDCEKKWNSFKEKSDRRVKIGSIIASYNHNPENFKKKVFIRVLAERVYLRLRGTLKKYRAAKDKWARFKGFHWCECDRQDAIGVVRPCLEEEYINYVKESKIPEQRKERLKLFESYQKSPMRYLNEVVNLFPSFNVDEAVTAEDFDCNPRYFGVSNGDIDLETGAFLQPDPSRMVSKFSKVSFDPKSTCPIWEKTLKECLVYDEVVEFFQRLVGYAALGKPKENKIIFLHGYGCNGKSTIMSVILEIFGSLGVAVRPEVLVSLSEKRFNTSGPTPEIMRMKGARIAVAEELPERSKVKSEALKRLAGTETLVARNMYEAPVEFKPTATMFLCTNHLPEIEDNGTGLWRRPVLIEFPRNFDTDKDVKKDTNLKDKLLAEASGILNWVIEGAKRYMREGLALPNRLDSALKTWRGEEDIVGTWIDENLEKTEVEEAVSMKDVYANFKHWAIECGADKHTSAWLVRRLKEKGFEIKRGTGNVAFAYGMKLREEEEVLEW